MDKLDKFLQEWAKNRKPGKDKLPRLREKIYRKVRHIRDKSQG